MDSTQVAAYAATVQAFTAIVLVWLTQRYVKLTGGMVAEMRAARQPVVYIDVEIEDGSMVVLIIGNSGDAPARHVQFVVDDGIPWEGKPLARPSELSALIDGLAYLAPGRRLRFMLGHLDWKKATEQSGWLNIVISYAGEEERKFVQPVNFDLRRYNGLKLDSFVTPQHKIAEGVNGLFRLAQDEALQKHAEVSFRKVCPACHSLMPTSATKCAACLEWLPEARPKASDPSAPDS